MPVIAHVPHASTYIPAAHRDQILLDDAALAQELVRMTDWHTDRLFAWVADRGATAFINERSRLVVDPERFEDASQEPMEALGQGAVYTRTTDGQPLRHADSIARRRLIETLFDPYHRALSSLVADQLDRDGRCAILDCHSFASVPLPGEVDQSLDRPDICIGTDAHHTPAALVRSMERAFEWQGFRVRRDSPFRGALVPLDRYRSDLRVSSIMIEVRRGLYCDEDTGTPRRDFSAIAAAIEHAVVDSGIFERPVDT